jgi:hypothetical protein
MKSIITIFIVLIITITGCNKDENNYSGTITINNELYGTGPYYGYGFHVPTGEKVSTLNSPLDVIALFVDFDIDFKVRKIYMSVNNYNNSFSKYGTYPNETAASDAFRNLKSFDEPQWSELADPIEPNQIWLFKTSDDKYAKIRIISTYSEKREGMPFPFAECTFEWVYQPDGSRSFQ